MGRARKSGAVEYDVVLPQVEYDALEARAEEHGVSVEEIVRADLLSADHKERLVPRARKLVRHAKINVRPEGGLPDRMEMPSLEPGLDD